MPLSAGADLLITHLILAHRKSGGSDEIEPFLDQMTFHEGDIGVNKKRKPVRADEDQLIAPWFKYFAYGSDIYSFRAVLGKLDFRVEVEPTNHTVRQIGVKWLSFQLDPPWHEFDFEVEPLFLGGLQNNLRVGFIFIFKRG